VTLAALFQVRCSSLLCQTMQLNNSNDAEDVDDVDDVDDVAG
jgi:hypothetical protein